MFLETTIYTCSIWDGRGGILHDPESWTTRYAGAAAVRYRTGGGMLYDPESWATTGEKGEGKMFLETTLYTGAAV